MAQIIKLGAERKKRARKEKEHSAQSNRVKFGRTGPQKKLEKTRSQQAKDFLDSHKITKD